MSCTRGNGLLTRGNEFSSGVFGGVSTCGDSDGLRARAPRRSPVREERSDAKDVGKIDSPSQRDSHFVSTLRRNRHTTGEKPAPKTAADAGAPKLGLETFGDDEMLTRDLFAILLIVDVNVS